MIRKDISPGIWIRNIAIITFALVVVGALAYYFIHQSQEKKRKENTPISVSLVNENQEDYIDTDNDGVPDWEEKLWGLDPLVIDTDNDGVTDDQYIRNKKNIQERRSFGAENVETTLSESEKLGRSIYTAILAIDESQGVLDDATQLKITDNIAEYISDIPVSGTLFVREDLALVSNTKEASYKYQEEVEMLFTEYPVVAEDVALIARAIDDPEVYHNQIQDLAEQYDILLNKLVVMEVPFAVGGRHTELLNSLGHITGSFKNLSQEEADELLTLSTIIQMEERLAQVSEAIINIQKFFDIIADPSVFEG